MVGSLLQDQVRPLLQVVQAHRAALLGAPPPLQACLAGAALPAAGGVSTARSADPGAAGATTTAAPLQRGTQRGHAPCCTLAGLEAF